MTLPGTLRPMPPSVPSLRHADSPASLHRLPPAIPSLKPTPDLRPLVRPRPPRGHVLVSPAVPGPPGPPGTGSLGVTATALAALSGHRVVTNVGGFAYASNESLGDAALALYLTLGAIENGAQGTGLAFGPVTEPSWSWTPGPVFLGTDGALTQTQPTSGFSRIVGFAESATSILFDPQPATILS